MTDLTPPEPQLTEFDMVNRLCWAWKASGVQERIGNGCIQATRIGLEVLAALEIRAKAVPCAVVVRNQSAVDARARGLPPADWPPDAWSVGIDPDAPPPGQLTGGLTVDSRDPKQRGWNGHLIIQGVDTDWLCDLTAAQFSRPLRNMDLPAWAAPIPALADPDDTGWLIRRDNGVEIRIYPRPELAAWRNGTAWRQDPDSDAILALTHLTLQGPRRLT